MFIAHRLPTSYGPVRISAPALFAIPSSPTAAMEFASRIDRQADACLAEGQFALAEQLSHLALEARCRATGARA
jgi:hypothetical protein